MENEFVGIGEAAKQTGVSIAEISGMIRRGEINPELVAGRRIFDHELLDEIRELASEANDYEPDEDGEEEE